MAIEPINISGFARNPIGIEAILQRGSSAFGAILRDAAQVAREQGNNQARQERDFLVERARVVNLDQRRGEFVAKFNEGVRQFDTTTEQFDRKFGEGVRQFDSTIEQASFDRVRRDRGLDIDEKRVNAGIEVDKERVAISREGLEVNKEDLEFRREKAKKEDKYDDVRIDLTKQQLENAKDDNERSKAKSSYESAVRDGRAKVLEGMDTLIKEGKVDDAKSLFRTHVENPVYEIPDNTRSRFARTLGIDKEKGAFSAEVSDTPPAELTLDEVEAELGVLMEAEKLRGATGDDPASEKITEKRATRIAELKRRQTEIQKGPKFMDRYK